MLVFFLDFILIAVWIVLFLIGGTIQFSLMKRQPVFPESPFVRRRLRQCQFPEIPQRGCNLYPVVVFYISILHQP